MAGPIIAAAGISAVEKVLAPLTGIVTTPAGSILAQTTNSLSPTSIPSFDLLLRMFHAWRISPAKFVDLCRRNGLAITAADLGVRYDQASTDGQVWPVLADVLRPQPPFELAKYWWLLKDQPADNPIYGAGRLQDLIARQGIAAEEDQTLFVQQSELLGTADILSARGQGLLSDADADRWLRRINWQHNESRGLILAASKPPDWGTVVQWYLRHPEASPAVLVQYLRWLGVIDDASQQQFLELVVSLPSAADVGRWLSTGIFDPAWVLRFGLAATPDSRYVDAIRRAGILGGGASTAVDTLGRPVSQDQLNYWIDHWRKLDPQTADLLSFRLGADTIGLYQSMRSADGSFPFSNVQPFSLEDRVTAYEHAGYSPSMARAVAAATTPLPSLRLLRQGVRLHTITPQYLTSVLQREGYSPDDVDALVETELKASGNDMTLAIVTEVERAKGSIVKLTATAGTNGFMDPQTAAQQLEGMGADAQDVQDLLTSEYQANELGWRLKLHEQERATYVKELTALYEMGAMSDAELANQLGGLGLPAVTLALITANLQLGIRRSITQEAIRTIEANYKDAAIDAATATAQLTALGLVAQRVALYLQEWRVRQTDRSKRLSTGEILRYYKDGLLSRMEAERRLVSLGWQVSDSLLQLADVDHQLQLTQSKLRSSEQHKQATYQRDLEKYKQQLATWSAKEQTVLVKSLETALKDSIAVAKAQASAANLDSWLKAGLLDTTTYVQAMRLRGYSDGVINLRYAKQTGAAAVTDVAGGITPAAEPGEPEPVLPGQPDTTADVQARTGTAPFKPARSPQPLAPIPPG